MTDLSNEQLKEKLRFATELLSHEHEAVRIHAEENVAVLTELLAYREAAENPVAWIHEDELPGNYPYDQMFPFSKVDIVRIFPVYAPQLPVVPDERAEFESFMSERFGNLINIRRAKNGDNEYMAWDVAVAWIAWQQRAIPKSASFRETYNSSTKHFREITDTSTKCTKCGAHGTYHCHQMLGTVECECALAAAPKPPATENK